MNVLLFPLLLLPTLLFAQPYVPFISASDSSDTWMDLYSCSDFDCYESYTKRYTISGDTTIGGLQYAKIYVKQKYQVGPVQSQWCTESTSYSGYYFGAVRESGKRIYVNPYGSPDSTEYVAYDFNLTVGDTLPSPSGDASGDGPNRVISSMDSVQVFGIYRKRYLVSSNRFVIEGIGASTGLFNPVGIAFGACDFRMLCYAENDTPDYFLNDCQMNLGTEELNPEKEPAQLVRIIDYLGRETAYTPNTPLIYVYSDGSTKRMCVVE